VKINTPREQSLIVAAVLCASSAHALAVDVQIKDSASVATSCGTLKQLDVTSSAVILEANGKCIGTTTSTTGTPVLPSSLSTVTLTAGTSQQIHLLQGATVKLPIVSALVGSPSAGSVVVNATNAYDPILTYTAPSSAQSLTLSYTIKDSTSSSATGSIPVTVTASSSGSGGGTTNSTCQTTDTLVCKDTPSWGGVLYLKVPLAVGVTHAWPFVYDGQSHQLVYSDGPPVDAMVSTTPGELPTANSYCSVKLRGEFALQLNSNACALTPGVTYYFNLKQFSTSGSAYNFSAL